MSSIKKNTLVENVTIVDVVEKGKSIAKTAQGEVIIVKGGVPGDIVNIKTTKKRRKVWQGMIVKIVEKSEFRVEPLCEHFGVCGGCSRQDISYEKQLSLKQNEVKNNFRKIARIDISDIMEPILGSDKTFYYRNKMEFSFSNNRWFTQQEINSKQEITDRNALGFHIPGMWDKILDIKKCHLQEDLSNEIRLFVRNHAVENNLEFFDIRQQTGFLRNIMLRNSTSGDWMVLVQFFENNESQINDLMSSLHNAFPQITSLLYVINDKANDTLYDLDIINFSGDNFIMEQMEGLQFKITAKSFYQTNPTQAYNLYKKVRDLADISKDDIVYDLYTGTGTIAQFLAKTAKKIVGIESVPDAIQSAKENAILNKIDNCNFFVGDMKDILNDDFVTKNSTPSVIITDPPRSGMHRKVVENILKISPQKIVYVSCNSATQARDIEILSQKYEITKSQAVDMFAHTHHIENIVLMKLKS